MFNFPPEICQSHLHHQCDRVDEYDAQKSDAQSPLFSHDDAVIKVVFLAIGNIAKKWTMPIKEWKPALNRFAIEFAERFPKEIYR